MTDITLLAVAGKQINHDDRTWEFTGDAEIPGTGEHLYLEAKRIDDVRHRTARLRFDVEGAGQSLNPGNVEEYFDRLEWEDGEVHVVVRTDERTYRYGLNGIEYE